MWEVKLNSKQKNGQFPECTSSWWIVCSRHVRYSPSPPTTNKRAYDNTMCIRYLMHIIRLQHPASWYGLEFITDKIMRHFQVMCDGGWRMIIIINPFKDMDSVYIFRQTRVICVRNVTIMLTGIFISRGFAPIRLHHQPAEEWRCLEVCRGSWIIN